MNRYIALQKIVELKSFSKAAESLGYTQSAISQMIASLESELSLQLLIRSRSGIVLSEDGERLYPNIEKAIREFHILEESARKIRGESKEKIRMGILSAISTCWLPSILEEFSDLTEGTDFLVRQGNYASIREWIRLGEIDFGIVDGNISEDLDSLVLKEGSILLALSNESPFLEEEVLDLETILKEPLILMEEEKSSRVWKELSKWEEGANIKYIIHNDSTVFSLIRKNMGIGFVDEFALLGSPKDIVFKETSPKIENHLVAVCKNREELPKVSYEFLSFLWKKVHRR